MQLIVSSRNKEEISIHCGVKIDAIDDGTELVFLLLVNCISV